MELTQYDELENPTIAQKLLRAYQRPFSGSLLRAASDNAWLQKLSKIGHKSAAATFQLPRHLLAVPRPGESSLKKVAGI